MRLDWRFQVPGKLFYIIITFMIILFNSIGSYFALYELKVYFSLAVFVSEQHQILAYNDTGDITDSHSCILISGNLIKTSLYSNMRMIHTAT